jgi:hypothetical protein
MVLPNITRPTELQMLQEELSSIPEVQQVFVQSSKTSLDVLIALPHHDVQLERRIAEIEGQIADSFPWLAVDFDVVLLQGRQLSDVVSPKGFQLFAR